MTKYSSYPITHPGHPNNRGTWPHRIWVSVSAANNIIVKRYRTPEDPLNPLKDKLRVQQVTELPHEECGDCHTPLTPDNASLRYHFHPCFGGDNHISNVYWVCRECNTPPNSFEVVHYPDGSMAAVTAAVFRKEYRAGHMIWMGGGPDSPWVGWLCK